MRNLGEKVFQKILDTLPNNIYVKDIDGRYLWINRSCIKLLASQHLIDDSIVGKTDFDIFPEQHAIKYAKNDKIIMESRQGSIAEEDVVLPSGEHLVQLSFKEPLIDDATSELLGIVGYTIDITERKILEVELLKSKNAAEAANRAKTEFLANMSHDVKTPMTGVVSVADLMMHTTGWCT
ncbi:MAG: PAS domain-containing protein, partial [Gammaproteobacteria bacterium]|nr:PAS domain-containing protein [Gammaproteobacteria bacterium]